MLRACVAVEPVNFPAMLTAAAAAVPGAAAIAAGTDVAAETAAAGAEAAAVVAVVTAAVAGAVTAAAMGVTIAGALPAMAGMFATAWAGTSIHCMKTCPLDQMATGTAIMLAGMFEGCAGRYISLPIGGSVEALLESAGAASSSAARIDETCFMSSSRLVGCCLAICQAGNLCLAETM